MERDNLRSIFAQMDTDSSRVLSEETFKDYPISIRQGDVFVGKSGKITIEEIVLLVTITGTGDSRVRYSYESNEGKKGEDTVAWSSFVHNYKDQEFKKVEGESKMTEKFPARGGKYVYLVKCKKSGLDWRIKADNPDDAIQKAMSTHSHPVPSVGSFTAEKETVPHPELGYDESKVVEEAEDAGQTSPPAVERGLLGHLPKVKLSKAYPSAYDVEFLATTPEEARELYDELNKIRDKLLLVRDIHIWENKVYLVIAGRDGNEAVENARVYMEHLGLLVGEA